MYETDIAFYSNESFVKNEKNMLQGGVQSNVIPEKLTAVFDVRIAVTVDHEQFEDMVSLYSLSTGRRRFKT